MTKWLRLNVTNYYWAGYMKEDEKLKLRGQEKEWVEQQINAGATHVARVFD